MGRRTAALRTLPQTRRARVRRELVRGAAAMGARRGRVVIWGLSSPRSSAEERVVSTHLAGGSNPSGGTVRPYSRHRARAGSSSPIALSPLSLPLARCSSAAVQDTPSSDGVLITAVAVYSESQGSRIVSKSPLDRAHSCPELIARLAARCQEWADSAQPRHSSCWCSSCPFSSCHFSSCPFSSCPFSS